MYGMKIRIRRHKEVIGGGLGQRQERWPACLLFSTLQKRRRGAGDKQCQVSHQHQEEGKHAGDISQAVKRLHSDAAAALFHSVFQLLRVESRNDSITVGTFLFPVYLPELSATGKVIL